MNTKTHDTRQHILDIGYELVVTKGFTRVGLAELLKCADVPKGSFYHYFKSKEHFGEALIQAYFEHYLSRIEVLFNAPKQNGYQRLTHYFERWADTENGTCNANRCLVVKLSGEVSDLSDSMRLALLDGAERIIAALAECIEQGIQDDSVRRCDSKLTARQLYQTWIGASLLNKLYQDQSGLKQSLISTRQLLQP
ncbi:TetR/AcrR family transcriptional regulator [Vibrio sp. V39_P1S14PM300]|uniref:TetR/AcrR family transcriptional regulator n=1 Tax=Vibrio sp. V39_P1S14PM300 TaxID=1938690 RepID=UPI00137299AA|nr:TetR/AcrR family transcriptional regulator [Vibrio sp. V39_P1S14PM300]NAX23431.1 TetR family transcriptional regulator [Vibrio sp. V39_P1S14PM300]